MFSTLKQWYIRRKLSKIWFQVGTQAAHITWTDLDETDYIYYYLFENPLGQRKVEYRETGYAKIYEKGNKHRFYLTEMIPWKNRNKDFGDIPSWEHFATPDELAEINRLLVKIGRTQKHTKPNLRVVK